MKKEIRFLCDSMCGDIALWLRAAGHDTLLVKGEMADKEIYKTAIQEQRILITRDKEFLQRKGAQEIVCLLTSNHFNQHIKLLNQKLSLNWVFKPLSRCLLCNCILEDAPLEVIDKLKPKIRADFNKFYICPNCKRVYWPGGHATRMLDKLRYFQTL